MKGEKYKSARSLESMCYLAVRDDAKGKRDCLRNNPQQWMFLEQVPARESELLLHFLTPVSVN